MSTLLLALCLLQSPAAEALAEAEAEVARGRYASAVRLYEEIAEDHPGTPEADLAARRAAGNALLGWATMGDSEPQNRVPLVFAGDGYEVKVLGTFEEHAEDAVEVFSRNEVLAEYLDYFHFVRAAVSSREDGVAAHGRTYDTAFAAHDSGKIGQDVDLDRERARALLEEVPAWDGLAVVIAKGGLRGTGADGVAVVGERTPEDLLRAFGGAFAGLGDELDVDQGVYMPVEDQPNISPTEERASVPWRHWLEAEVPGVGVYPGGLGRVDGVFRPVPSNCAMNDTMEYCPVCREAIVLAIHRSVDPIDEHTPETGEELAAGRRVEFEVRVMRPDEHALEVAWYVLPEQGAPAPPRPRAGMESVSDRRSRGPLAAIAAEPAAVTKPDRKGWASFELRTSRLEPGRHVVVCRVRDTTEVRGSKHPWVLADPDGLLQSERVWTVRVPE